MKTRALPREMFPGVYWLGECLEIPYFDKTFHNYNSAFLVAGSRHSLIVEAGHPRDFTTVHQQLESLLKRSDVPPLRYIFVTHQETPHSANMARLMDLYPDTITVGDMADYHLVFPMFEDRFQNLKLGDTIDLGDREFVAVEPVIRDLPTTLWGFDTKSRVLFPGDGFAFSHYHEEGHCGHFGEELSTLDIPTGAAIFAEYALFWTKFVDMSVYVDRLEEQIRELGVRGIGPTHGLAITNVDACFDEVRRGLKYGSELKKTSTQIAPQIQEPPVS